VFLLAILAVAAAVGIAFKIQREQQAGRAPVLPKPLARNLQAASKDWVYFKGEGDHPIVEIRARDMERIEEPAAKVSLRQVELKLYHKDGREYDHVKSDTAEFDEAAGALFAEGEVEITLAVPADGSTKERLLAIRSSGVRFDAATGVAVTDRPARFYIDLGEGEAVGASYDPATRELVLKSHVSLIWRGHDPARPPMKIRAGQLSYKENESMVYLGAPSRFERQTLSLDGADAQVKLEEGAIRLVDAQKAQGIDAQPKRRLEFAANHLVLELTPKSEIEKITGTGDANLTALSASAQTRITTDRIDMHFDVRDGDSLLREALANGKVALESKPVPKPNAVTGPTRLLRSESVVTRMRPGGVEIDMIETHAPGVFELLPNAPDQPKRRLDGTRMWIKYARNNALESFRAVEVATRTDKPAEKGKKPPPPGFTTSNDLQAFFDTSSGDMTRLEQWTNFKYREGEQQAAADKAVLEQPGDRIILTGNARSWDNTGSLSAKRIVLSQQVGRVLAEGDVHSTRQPDGKDSGGGMLSGDEPLHARGERMTAVDNNMLITYEGHAVLWQSSNRLQGTKIQIDRRSKALLAEGNVISQFAEQSAPPGAAAPLTVIRSEKMKYTDSDRMAYYTGGVRLVREGLDVRSAELKAWLNEGGDKAKNSASKTSAANNRGERQSQSRLNRAFADGQVQISQSAGGRTRRGVSEHAEYYVDDGKVVLTGGNPTMVDSVKGYTRGKKLTYWANNDSLQVEGVESQPAASRIRRN
jgi:lipopolysaccharide export system protein LptA